MAAKRNEQYPSMPGVGWSPTHQECEARRDAVDWRNTMIGEDGARAAAAAAKRSGGNIGAGKREAKAK